MRQDLGFQYHLKQLKLNKIKMSQPGPLHVVSLRLHFMQAHLDVQTLVHAKNEQFAAASALVHFCRFIKNKKISDYACLYDSTQRLVARINDVKLVKEHEESILKQYLNVIDTVSEHELVDVLIAS